jgi:hypothetical protein
MNGFSLFITIDNKEICREILTSYEGMWIDTCSVWLAIWKSFFNNHTYTLFFKKKRAIANKILCQRLTMDVPHIDFLVI